MSFRNTIGTTALANTQSYLGRYTRDETEEYIRSALIYYGEIPFLYRVFDPTNVRSVKEKGGYKVVSIFHPPPSSLAYLMPMFLQVRHGIFQHQAIIDTMLVYYGKQGTKACIPTASIPGENPIGVLALVCTAVGIYLSHCCTVYHSHAGFRVYRSNVRCPCTLRDILSRPVIRFLINRGDTGLLSI